MCLALGLLVRISVVARKIRVTVDAADDVQLVVPIATGETVRVLSQLIDARSKHYARKFKKRTIAQGDAIVELQIDGAALFDDDILDDILSPNDVVRAIWAGTNDTAAEYTMETGDQHLEHGIKPNARPRCGRFSACPPCTQASCFWCSSTHSCVDRATSACPLQKPRITNGSRFFAPACGSRPLGIDAAHFVVAIMYAANRSWKIRKVACSIVQLQRRRR